MFRSLQMATAGSVLLVAAALVAPVSPAVRLPDTEAGLAWSAQLERSLGPDLADCVRVEVTGHASPIAVDAMVARARGDQRLLPAFGVALDRALARCTRRPLPVR